MPEHKPDKTPFDEMNERDKQPDATHSNAVQPHAVQPSAPQPQKKPAPQSLAANALYRKLLKQLELLKAARRSSPDILPTGTLIGLSMTAGALVVIFCSVLLHFILPRPKIGFQPSQPIAALPRARSRAIVEIAPGDSPAPTPVQPLAVEAVHNSAADATVQADVIKDPEAFELDQKMREQRRLDDQKIIDQRKAEDQKIIDQRKIEDQKLIEQQRTEEDQRLTDERKRQDDKLAAERALEDQRQTAERQLAEQRKLEADQKTAADRKTEDQRLIDARKLEDAKRLEERQQEDKQKQLASTT